jgi:acetyltransferase-like isoleucine patch superfamily enzyme
MGRLATGLRRRTIRMVFNRILTHIPGYIGHTLRVRWLQINCLHIGEGCSIGHGVIIMGVENLSLGDRVAIPRNCHIDARGGLTLADYALVGFESVILTHTHNSDDPESPIQHQGMFSKPVYIGPKAWLGTRVIVQPGVTIGEGAIVGSGAVVTKDVAPYDVVAGVPARILRNRLADRGPASSDASL